MSSPKRIKFTDEVYPEIDLGGLDDFAPNVGGVNEFVVPDIVPILSFLSPQIYKVPQLYELSNVERTSTLNLYNAEITLPKILNPLEPQQVSFLVMSNITVALQLEDRMQRIADIVGKDRILGTKLILNTNPRMTTGSYNPCLLTEAVPSLTVYQFLAGKPTLSVKRQFFKLLWSALSKLHEARTFFGNLPDGLRVLDNKPVLTFPSTVAEHLGRGILNDLLHVIALAIEAFSDLVIELRCFLSICRDVIQTTNITGIRAGSYWILHHNLVWSPEDGSRFVLRLHEYYQDNPVVYRQWTDDGYIVELPHLAVDYDWKGILDRPAGRNDAVFKLANAHYREAIAAVHLDGRAGVFDNSESLRYLIRCRLAHLPTDFPVERVINSINEIFPEAMSRLYYMCYRRFHFMGWLDHFQFGLMHMKNFVEFFRFGPGKHNAFQF